MWKHYKALCNINCSFWHLKENTPFKGFLCCFKSLNMQCKNIMGEHIHDILHRCVKIQQTSQPTMVKQEMKTWWRHQMETLSALLALCVGNSPVTGEFPSQRPATRSFDVFFDLHLNKRLSKQSWFEMLSRSSWRHCNDYHISITWSIKYVLHTSRPKQSCRNFADGIFKCIFFNENMRISLKVRSKFVTKIRIR